MTADSFQKAGLAPGWFVHTDLGVTLSPRFEEREPAQQAYWDIVADLRRDMVRAHRTRASIEEHVGAVHIGYGVVVGAWEEFEARAEP